MISKKYEAGQDLFRVVSNTFDSDIFDNSYGPIFLFLELKLVDEWETAKIFLYTVNFDGIPMLTGKLSLMYFCNCFYYEVYKSMIDYLNLLKQPVNWAKEGF
jgi:hypothetical protein